MALAREDAASLTPAELAQAWPDDAQRDRCLASLVADGLIERTRAGRYRLPR
jgi:A/G-specific adenine glycosylase